MKKQARRVFAFVVIGANLLLISHSLAIEEEQLRASSLESSALDQSEPNRMSAGFGLSYYGSDYAKLYGTGQVGFSINAGFLKQIAKAPVYAGVDFGISFFGFGNSTSGSIEIERGAYGVQLLPSIIYRGHLPRNPNISPYLGFSMGPHLLIRKDSSFDRVRGTVDSSSITYGYFQFLARPGLDFLLAEGLALNLESKFGILGASFNWLPQMNIVILL